MFDYPLPKPSNTLYHKLGLTPEATAAEIRDAKTESEKELQARRKSVEKKLNSIDEALPDLKKVQKKITRMKIEQNTEDVQKLLDLIQQQSSLEKEAESINPDYKKLQKELNDLEEEINELHSMQLEKEEDRSKYDRKTPPCAILKLEQSEFPIFSDRKTSLFLLRSELSCYFEKILGISCYHPTDHTRNEFQKDFAYNPLLDGKKGSKNRKKINEK